MTTRLTATSTASLRRCPRQYYWRFGLGLSRIRTATPLRFGRAFHKGIELRPGIGDENAEADPQAALDTVLAGYAETPAWADPTDWAVERETLRALLLGYYWRYGKETLTHLAVEQAFQVPLVNPDTGSPSRAFTVAGRIDGIVRLPDGRMAVLEVKTCSEDISPDSEYWLRLRGDGQISLYVLAARALGYDAATVLYDVTRKPTIRLRKAETPEQYGDRLLADIGARPDYYYQRREVPRLDGDLLEYQAELWQQAQHVLATRRRASALADPSRAWFRNVGRMTCGYCEFADLCLSGVGVDPASPPAGYELLADPHPELAEED